MFTSVVVIIIRDSLPIWLNHWLRSRHARYRHSIDRPFHAGPLLWHGRGDNTNSRRYYVSVDVAGVCNIEYVIQSLHCRQSVLERKRERQGHTERRNNLIRFDALTRPMLHNSVSWVGPLYLSTIRWSERATDRRDNQADMFPLYDDLFVCCQYYQTVVVVGAPISPIYHHYSPANIHQPPFTSDHPRPLAT